MDPRPLLFQVIITRAHDGHQRAAGSRDLSLANAWYFSPFSIVPADMRSGDQQQVLLSALLGHMMAHHPQARPSAVAVAGQAAELEPLPPVFFQ